MNVRVTGQTQVANAVAYLRQQSAALAKYQDQLGSGVRVKAPSDDPARYPLLAQAKAAGQRYDAYLQTTSDATATLNAGVSSLQEVNDVLVQAKQIAQEGANSTNDAGSYEALASQVDTLIGRMTQAANSQSDGRYLFGGTATDKPPFQVTTDAQGRPTAVTYDGSADRGRALIGPGQTVDTRYAGSAVFQQSGADVFQALIGLRDDLRDPSTTDATKAQALTQRMTALDAARDVVSGATAEQSSSLASLDAIQSRLQDLKLDATSRATDLEGTDYADAAVRMQQQETALQATMAVSARLFQPSFLDFIQ